MSAPTCPPCADRDSPLSIIANVLGILTFVYAVAIGIMYRITLIRKAKHDFHRLTVDVRAKMLQKELSRKEMKNQMQASKLSTSQTDKLFDTMQLNSLKVQQMLDSWANEPWQHGGWADCVLGIDLVARRDKLKQRLDRIDEAYRAAQILVENASGYWHETNKLEGYKW